MNSCVALLFALFGLASAAGSNPVSRIVTLLNGLKDKLEEDLKAETDLFETYACWCKTTTSTKESSNDAAGSRVDSLKTYIKDIEAGKIEFTTERQDLEKQIAGLSKDLETAKVMRENENKDFLAAETEMKQAVSALDSAIKTIDASLAQTGVTKTRSYVDMLSTRHSIQKSIAFARAFLDASEAKNLEDMLNDDEPKPDWKKLNRKADHKMKYVKSSGKIMDTLKKLKTTFAGNLEEAQKNEKEAKESYEKLSTSKGGMLEKAKKAATDMSLEGGARGVSKTEAQNEVDALEAQVTADTKFISETEASFKTKEAQWEARKELRSKEILAMSQAIAVLASDDAKDQFKSSFKSQGYSLLQEFAEQNAPNAKCAKRLIQTVASKSSDPRLALLATQASNARIEKVVEKVDEIIKMKEEEEKTDLVKKEKCEKDLSDAASKSRTAALAMDTASEDITRAEGSIAELKTQIKEQEEKKTGLQGQIKEATNNRNNENALFKIDVVQDEKAIELVESAINIIKDWKNAKKAALISQVKKIPIKLAAPTAPEGILPAPKVSAPVAPHQASLAAAAIKVHTAKSSTQQAPQFQVDAGAAPPPPPPTFEGEYKGAGEQGGIVGILDLVKMDMEKDVKSAKTDEAESLKDFKKAKADMEDEIKATDTTIDAYTKDKASKEKTLVDKTKERSTKKGELDGSVKLYEGLKPGCDFLLVNFELRVKARQIEVDGLKKAKAILKGGKFGKALIQEMC